jgi:hypothetical protein
MDLDTTTREALLKARKKTNPGSVKKALLVLEAVGIDIVHTETAPRKRSPYLYVLDVPGIGQIEVEQPENYRRLPPEYLTVPRNNDWMRPFRRETDRGEALTPEQQAKLDAWEAKKARYKATVEYIVEKASELLGLPNPNERAGLPPRARDYRTDLTIRTCPCCFRDIKASEHTSKRMADHGYTINGRDWSGYGGFRQGGCRGGGRDPWEKSCEPAKEQVEALIDLSSRVEARLYALENGEVTELTVVDQSKTYNWRTEPKPTKTVTPDDGYEWKNALDRAITATRRDLRQLWSGGYGSIPWYRMAIRTWKPIPDDHIAVGAPSGRPSDEDFAGQPEVL